MVRLVKRRREAKHVFYALADEHLPPMLRNAIEHAAEAAPQCPRILDTERKSPHDDLLGADPSRPCSRARAGLWPPSRPPGENPEMCTSDHRCVGHEAGHAHGPGCGHEAVPHGNHVDYHVSGHLHHPHGDHCDDHGPLTSA